MTLSERLGFTRSKLRYPEIVDDMLAVRALLERLRAARHAEGDNDPGAKSAMDIAEQMLRQADKTSLLEEQWSCINRANAMLAYACKTRDEQQACLLRMKNLLPLLSGFKERLPDPFRSFAARFAEVREYDPRRAFEVLATATQGWHLVNEQNAFSMRIWRRALSAVAVLLILAVFGMELSSLLPLAGGDAAAAPAAAGATSWAAWLASRSYVWSVVFGSFGGALSMLLSSRGVFVSATTFRVSVSQAYVRLLLGGVGAFVVVLAIESGVVFNSSLSIDSFGALAIVAVGSGFSERLFLAALERIAGTIEESRPAARGANERDGASPQSVAGSPGGMPELVESVRLADIEDVREQEAVAFDALSVAVATHDQEDSAEQDSGQLAAMAGIIAEHDADDSRHQDDA